MSPPPPHVVEDCLGVVQLLSDGTVTRPSVSLLTADPPPAHAHRELPDVQWKDVVYDEAHDLRLRVYKPNTTTGGENEIKLPVLVYFHGGGFCIASFAHPSFHAVALRFAHDLPALVLSADYRLAPEHRLPAAHHDAEALLSWLRRQATTTSSGDHPCWFSSSSADFERVFVCGDSAGGNIAHHVAVRYGSPGAPDLAPIRIAGCVLLWPYFGGEDRTASELAALTDALMSLALFDQMWRLALPAGATRDHPAANPFGADSAPLDVVGFPPALVVDPEEDLLRDRIGGYVARLKAMGKPVELVEFTGQGHAFFVYDPWGAGADELLRVLRRFVYGTAETMSAARPPADL